MFYATYYELNCFRYVQCSITAYNEFCNHVYVGMFLLMIIRLVWAEVLCSIWEEERGGRKSAAIHMMISRDMP